MRCPNCKLINPDNALRCDCGYTFSAQEADIAQAKRMAQLGVDVQAIPSAAGGHPRKLEGSVRLLCYSPDELRDCARRLYARAAAIIWACMLAGLVGGAVAFGVVGVLLAKHLALSVSSLTVALALVGGVLGAMGGYEEGKSRSVYLRWRSQIGLCLTAIEINTRSAEE